MTCGGLEMLRRRLHRPVPPAAGLAKGAMPDPCCSPGEPDLVRRLACCLHQEPACRERVRRLHWLCNSSVMHIATHIAAGGSHATSMCICSKSRWLSTLPSSNSTTSFKLASGNIFGGRMIWVNSDLLQFHHRSMFDVNVSSRNVRRYF